MLGLGLINLASRSTRQYISIPVLKALNETVPVSSVASKISLIFSSNVSSSPAGGSLKNRNGTYYKANNSAFITSDSMENDLLIGL